MKTHPAFVVYAINSLILVLNITFLWVYSGLVRGKKKTVWNPEDTTTVAKGAAVIVQEPAEVARVLRAHNNAVVNILPFLVLAFVLVGLNVPAMEAWILFGSFSFFRWMHSLMYLGGKQPFRTLVFVGGLLATLAVMVEIVRFTLAG
ncbi:MAG: MAPEG family protein [Deltaproteobacteria bacterium]|nr:MAPEG family protein [Deltaproteobacteria bacterium]